MSQLCPREKQKKWKKTNKTKQNSGAALGEP